MTTHRAGFIKFHEAAKYKGCGDNTFSRRWPACKHQNALHCLAHRDINHLRLLLPMGSPLTTFLLFILFAPPDRVLTLSASQVSYLYPWGYVVTN